MPNNWYQPTWTKIVNILQNSNLKISRIAQAGSRAKRQNRPDSDMDIIFSVSGNPTREQFYPDLINVLKSNYPNENVGPGSNYNVVHLNIKNGGKFDLVLLSENEFDKEYKLLKDFRRDNL